MKPCPKCGLNRVKRKWGSMFEYICKMCNHEWGWDDDFPLIPAEGEVKERAGGNDDPL